mmetsp:Transcript_22576/g.57139  ORF Transcript_22576/g.57139 Transcript_22576/m.57139 type:complete len:682 (-) Transcript_22576:467-2512(-)
MSQIATCPICLEGYVRGQNPPFSCVPCGHVVCEPCLSSWRRQLPYFATVTCPLCRAQVRDTMMNRTLMDVLEDTARAARTGGASPSGSAPASAPSDGAATASAPAASDSTNSTSTDPSAAPPITSPAAPNIPTTTIDPISSQQGPIASTQFGFFPPPRRSGSLFMLPDGTSITLASSQTQTASHKSTMVHEILPEKSAVCFYVIDNSGSMGRDDGKKFIGMGMTRSGVSPLLKKGHGSVSRWEEAAFKTMQIAVYNLRRKMRATYYLLNPSTSRTDWIDGVDQVTLDASDCDLEQLASELEKHFEEFDGENKQGSRAVTLLPRLLRLITTAPNVRTLCELLERSNNSTFAKKLHILHFGILHSGNIRGSTPLHSVTNYLQSELQATIDLHNSNTDGGAITTSTTTSTSSPPPVRQIHALPINLNLITDGEPDNRVQFENQLRKMCSEFRASLAIMLTINLCTDDDDVVEYYNELDKKLGNEINGLDVLDDLESEQLEILKAGNSFVTYSEEIHVARMAGCNAVIADAIDEEQLSVFHATKMAREVLGLGQVQVAPPGGVEDVVGEASVGTGPGGAVARRGGGVGLEESGQQSQQQQEHEKDKSLRYQQVAGEQEVPSWYDETEELLQILKSRNRDVYDFYNRGMRPLVNVGKLDSMISWHKRKEGVTNFIGGLFGFGGGKR